MKVKKVGSQKEIEFKFNKYIIEWDKPCRSKFQKEVKDWFHQYWWKYICLEELLLPGSRLRCDLVNLTKRIIIEINGDQHDEYNAHFHRNCRTNFRDQIHRDQIKRNWAENNNFQLIEIYMDDLPLTLDFFKEKFNVNVQ